jgi:hypothetical protein
MITNFQVNPDTLEASGTYNGGSFVVSPKVENDVVVALSEQECAEFLDRQQREQLRNEQEGYKGFRINNYPSIGDQLDALWKGGDAAAEMLAKVQAVKAKYPKPTE